MAGRHRKPTMVRDRVVGFLLVSLSMGGVVLLTFIPILNTPDEFTPDSLSYRPPTATTQAPIAAGQEPTSSEPVAVETSPPPTNDPTPTTIAPQRPVQRATEQPLPSTTTPPTTTPPSQAPDPVQASSEPPVIEEAPDPQTEPVEQVQGSPSIVDILPNLLCLAQRGLGLQNKAALATADIVSKFDFTGRLLGRGGRAGVSDHPSGLATDFFAINTAQGNAIRDYALSNKARLGVKYVIYRQRYYDRPGTGRAMEDRGSDTQNHYDHVHVSFVVKPGSDFAPRCG
jgi:hypothetical protein